MTKGAATFFGTILFSSLLFGAENPFIPRLDSTITGAITGGVLDAGASTYSASVGEGLDFRDFSLKMCFRIPTTKFSLGTKKEDFTGDKFSNIGASLRLNKICHVPVTFMAGRINIHGALAGLYTPYISTSVRSFGDIISIPRAITATLPTPSSIEKAASFLVSYDSKGVADNFSLTGPLVKRVELAFLSNDEADIATSGVVTLRLAGNNFLSLSQTFLMCKVESKSNSWYSAVPLFPPTQYWFSKSEVFFNSAHFVGKATINIYQFNSGNSPRTTVAFRGAVPFRYFSLNLSGFYATDVLTFLPGGGTLKIVTQGKVNPLFTVPLKNLEIKIGGCYYIEERLNSSYEKRLNQKFGAGVLLSNKSFTGKLSFECSDKKDSPAQYKVISAFVLKAGLRPAFGATYSFYEEDDGPRKFDTYSTQVLTQRARGLVFYLKENLAASWENTSRKSDNLTAGFGCYLLHRAKFATTRLSLTARIKIGYKAVGY